jgi:hypothetical protein
MSFELTTQEEKCSVPLNKCPRSIGPYCSRTIFPAGFERNLTSSLSREKLAEVVASKEISSKAIA